MADETISALTAARTRHEPGVHQIPSQTHVQTRGHQAHLDVREHTDPNVLITVAFEVSTNSGPWEPGGGFTSRGEPNLRDKNGDPVRYAIAHFGHEPTPRYRDHRGEWVGSDPAAHRLVRGSMKVEGGSVNTRLHIVGTADAKMDQSLIPTD